MYLTRQYLATLFPKRSSEHTLLSENERAQKNPNCRRIFLSHSHQDKDLVIYIRELFHSLRIDLYVDWLDEGLSATLNRKVIDKIKLSIFASDFLVMLVTPNSLSSKWVPWEVGLKEGKSKLESVIMLPVGDESDFKGNEYLNLYPVLEQRTLHNHDIGRTLTGLFINNNGKFDLLTEWIQKQ